MKSIPFFILHISHFDLFFMNQKILIVDDDNEFVFIVQKILKSKDCTLYTASNLTEGMKALEQYQPDIIYLDNLLPDGHGWEKVDYILAHYPNIQLILISALDVPKTSTSSFRIIEKQLLVEELSEILPS